MSRLTNYVIDSYIAKKFSYNIIENMSDDDFKAFDEIVQKLGRYEDLEERGRLLKLPCEVGERAYYIKRNTKKKFIISSFIFDYEWLGYFDSEELYATKEAAEAKLKELKVNNMDFTIKEKPFSWNDNFSEVALEDFSMIQKSLSYGTAQTIGMALAKLELLEKQGCEVVEQKQGQWEEADDGDGIVCSVCGTDFCTLVFETDKFQYCPNCGAKMEQKGE